jgi:histidinol-phosphate aminotransferase
MNNLKFTLSRRGFTQLLGAGAAVAALRPALALSATARRSFSTTTAGAPVRLSSNENPYGPSPAALRAMTDAFGLAWRYPDEHADALGAALAEMHGVAPEHILLGNGSGEILKVAAAALTGPGRGLVVAEPTFEAIARHAAINGAQVSKIPLTADYRHDLAKMLAVKDVGLIYICNPNNPTASLTPKTELRAFIAQTPPQTIVLVDEAYHHYAESNDYESMIPLVASHPNLIVARTFSKIYGMAGLRCGYCVAHPEVSARLRAQQTWDSMNIMALTAALASLQDTQHVADGRRMNSAVKQQVCTELERMRLSYIPSAANFLMVDLRRDVRPFIKAMGERHVEVGRFFPALPTHMRVTIGTQEQMQTFLAALHQVLA